MRLTPLALAPALVFLLGLTAHADPGRAQEPPASEDEGHIEDRISVLRTLTVEPDERVRDAVCLLCPVVVRGSLQGDAVAVWGGVDVEGQVDGDAVAVGGALRVSKEGGVAGEPVAIGGPVEVAPEATVVQDWTALPWFHFPGQRQLFPLGVVVFLAGHLLIALTASLLLGERRVAHLTAIWLWSPGRTLLRGLLVFSAVVAAISLGGVAGKGFDTAAGIAGGTVLIAAFALGMPPVALVLGRRLRPDLQWRGAILLGALVIALASLVPVAGLAVSLVLWCAVCGLAVRGIAYRRSAQQARPDGAPEEVQRYYALGLEEGRLDEAYFPLERARTRELILRHLPPTPGVVLDVGGAAGAYAFWLAEQGHEVHLVDPAPLHVEQAGEASRVRDSGKLASARVGVARELDFADASVDAVLLLGPLYHLTDADERRAALDEASRVLRPGGWLFAAAISRFASLLDGLRGPVFEDEAFARIVEADLADGQHRNDTDNPLYFTTAFFHEPGELSAEVGDAGFQLAGLYAVEGPGAFVPDFARRWGDPANRERLLELLRRVEREAALLGASPHLLAIGQKAPTSPPGKADDDTEEPTP